MKENMVNLMNFLWFLTKNKAKLMMKEINSLMIMVKTKVSKYKINIVYNKWIKLGKIMRKK